MINFISTNYFASAFVKGAWNTGSAFSIIYDTKYTNYMKAYLLYVSPTESGWASNTSMIYIKGY